MTPGGAEYDPTRITRPMPALLTYYTIVAALTVLGFPFVFPYLYFRYHTMRYTFDGSGVSMAWGILFHREISLTYRRIQDIHVSRNIVQRWLGLASVAIQTASGSAGAEMTIEGVENPEALRDHLYAQMRGARGNGEGEAPGAAGDTALALLREIRDQVRRLAAEPRGEEPRP